MEFSEKIFDMKFIEPKIHGFIDYMAGVILIATHHFLVLTTWQKP